MTWIKMDDRIFDHPKFVGLPDSAFMLWFRGLCYASQNETDGFVPCQVAVTLVSGSRPSRVRQYLLDRDIWVTVSGGYQISNYLDHQRSKAEIDAIRDAARDRGKRRRSNVRANVARTNPEGSRNVREPDTDTDNYSSSSVSTRGGPAPAVDDDDPSPEVIHRHLVAWARANGKRNPNGYAVTVAAEHTRDFDGLTGPALDRALEERWPVVVQPVSDTRPAGVADLGNGVRFMPGTGLVIEGPPPDDPTELLSDEARAALALLEADAG